MTVDEIKNLYIRVTKQREEMLPEYQKLIKECFPDAKCERGDIMNPESSLLDIVDYETSMDMIDKFYGEQPDFEYKNFFYNFSGLCETYGECKFILENRGSERRYADTKTLHFENKDVLITDPCYIIRRDMDDDWERSDYGENFESLGINTYISRSTIYGDWLCTVISTGDNTSELGEFCADSGMVAVFDLDEVRAYNNTIDEWIENHNWCATVLKNYTGDVTIRVNFDEKGYEFYCFVEGKGSIDFESIQTGL